MGGIKPSFKVYKAPCSPRAKAHLVSLQHVQAQQHVHRLVLKDGKGTRKEVSFYLDLSCRIKLGFIKPVGLFPDSFSNH